MVIERWYRSWWSSGQDEKEWLARDALQNGGQIHSNARCDWMIDEAKC